MVWVEGCVEGVTGWSFGVETQAAGDRTAIEAAALYAKLNDMVVPLYYRQPDGFLDVMRPAIALNGSFFNSHRMIEEYR